MVEGVLLGAAYIQKLKNSEADIDECMLEFVEAERLPDFFLLTSPIVCDAFAGGLLNSKISNRMRAALEALFQSPSKLKGFKAAVQKIGRDLCLDLEG
jgi:hypothetical protein